MQRYFSLDMPASRFARNTLIVSLAGIAPLLLLFIVQTPGFASHLAAGGPALTRFARQVLTNGLPVVFVINYVSFFLFAWQIVHCGGRRARLLVLVVDLWLRVFLFIFLHAIIYVISADWFESFGGSRLTALRTVAPTLARSALFENVSGVYLYATLLSALPLYVSILRSAKPARPILSGRMAAVLASLALFGLSALALTALARLIVRLQSG